MTAGRGAHSRRGSALQRTVILLLVVSAGACRDGRDAESPFGKPSTQLQENSQDVSLRAKMASCTDRSAVTARVREVASLFPRELDTLASGQRAGPVWEPTGIDDIAPLGDLLAVLDTKAQEISILSRDLSVIGKVGRSGEGPGEYRNPARLGVDLAERRWMVYDPAIGRVTYLDSIGRMTRINATNATNVEDIVGQDGAAYFSHVLIPELFERGESFRVMLSTQPYTATETAVISRTAVPRNTDALPMPGPNRFRVVRHKDRMFLFSPASNIVQMFDGTKPTAVIRTCMPSDVRKAYDRQRDLHESGQRGNSQQAFPLITDVMTRGDTVFVVGPLRDQAERLHVDRYTLDGTSLGSVTAFVGAGGFPLDVRFWRDPYDLVAFGPQGSILRVVMEPTP